MAAGDVDVKITSPLAKNCNWFDGVDDYIEIAHNDAQLGVNYTNGFTVSAWIFQQYKVAGINYVLSKSTGTEGQDGFVFGSAETANPTWRSVLRVDASANITNSNNDVVANESWQHILTTVSSAGVGNSYYNGIISIANQNMNKAMSTIDTTGVMRIGNYSHATTGAFFGGIAEIKMWNRELTAAEVLDVKNGKDITNGLIYYFKLGGDYNNYGSEKPTSATNSGSIPQLIERRIGNVIKNQRGAGTDTWLICDIDIGQQVLTTNIRQA